MIEGLSPNIGVWISDDSGRGVANTRYAERRTLRFRPVAGRNYFINFAFGPDFASGQSAVFGSTLSSGRGARVTPSDSVDPTLLAPPAELDGRHPEPEPIDTPAPPPTPTLRPTPTPELKPTPTPELKPTPTPDTSGPSVTKLFASPAISYYGNSCTSRDVSVTFGANVSDPSGISKVEVWYRYEGAGGASGWWSLTLTDGGGGAYRASLDNNKGPLADNTLNGGDGMIRWYLLATDGVGNITDSGRLLITLQYCKG